MRRRALRHRYGRSKARFTWTVGWTLSGGKERTQSFRSRKAAETHKDWLVNRGYTARVFKWYWDEPHERTS